MQFQLSLYLWYPIPLGTPHFGLFFHLEKLITDSFTCPYMQLQHTYRLTSNSPPPSLCVCLCVSFFPSVGWYPCMYTHTHLHCMLSLPDLFLTFCCLRTLGYCTRVWNFMMDCEVARCCFKFARDSGSCLFSRLGVGSLPPEKISNRFNWMTRRFGG